MISSRDAADVLLAMWLFNRFRPSGGLQSVKELVVRLGKHSSGRAGPFIRCVEIFENIPAQHHGTGTPSGPTTYTLKRI
jgi:hypothetical protein